MYVYEKVRLQTGKAKFEYYNYLRSSHRRCSIQKAFLKNYAIFIAKRLC